MGLMAAADEQVRAIKLFGKTIIPPPPQQQQQYHHHQHHHQAPLLISIKKEEQQQTTTTTTTDDHTNSIRATRDESSSTTSTTTTTTTTNSSGGGGEMKRPDKIIPCPRCNSMETKFCYFNNYNVNQPRHFCKGCHRYWTAGGALRNVPVGAGRRKSKPPGSVLVGGDGSSGNCVFEASVFDFDRVVLEEYWAAQQQQQQYQQQHMMMVAVASGGGGGEDYGGGGDDDFPAKRMRVE